MQKQPKILNYKNLNIEKYQYLQPHKTDHGYYQSICNYRLTKNQLLPFYFETPKLKTTSGIVRVDNNYYIDLELPQSGEYGDFYNFLIKNDDNNISVCHENAKEWFNQIIPLNIVENYYKTSILLRPNGNLPIIRIKIPSYKGNILTEIFNVRKEKINDISCIQEGDFIIGILEFVGLKFMQKNFLPCYELQKIKIFKDNDFRAIPNGYIFSDTDDTIDLTTTNMQPTDTLLNEPVDNFINLNDTKLINISKEYNIATIKNPIPIKKLTNTQTNNQINTNTGTDTKIDTNIDTNIDIKNNIIVILPELKDIIDKNDYVFSCVSNKKKDYNSLSYLIEKDLSQSDCIKLGIGIEKVLKDIIISKNINLKNIKPINKKGQKEKDHLFKDETTKTIYYAEIKSNLNLDTEKCKSTSEKCSQIKEELKIEFPDYEIKMFLVGIRYYEKNIIPKIISNKYISIADNLFGINDYLSIMNSNIKIENEKKYIDFLNYLSSKMFNY